MPRPTTTYSYTQVQPRVLGAGGWTNSAPVTVPDTVRNCATAATCAGGAAERVTDIDYAASSVPNNGLPVWVTTRAGNGSVSQTRTVAYTPAGDIASVDGPLPGTGDTTIVT